MVVVDEDRCRLKPFRCPVFDRTLILAMMHPACRNVTEVSEPARWVNCVFGWINNDDRFNFGVIGDVRQPQYNFVRRRVRAK